MLEHTTAEEAARRLETCAAKLPADLMRQV
jgi:hypothetical protein